MNRIITYRISSTSKFTEHITPPTIYLSTIDYSDASSLNVLAVHTRKDLEVRNTSTIALVKATGNIGIKMWKNLWVNNYDIAGGKHVGTNNHITAGRDN